MAFNPCEHQKVEIIKRAGAIIRQLKGLPEEKNITRLYNETASLLGLPVAMLNSTMGNRLPSPGENPDWPKKPCPKCGKMAFLGSICQSCKDAEGGKYKSGYLCDERFGGCGFVDDKTDEWITQRLSRMGIQIQTGTKESLGIGTKTDQGVK